MFRCSVSIVLLAILCVQTTQSAPGTLSLNVGTSFIHYITLDGGQLEKCELDNDEDTVSLYPNKIQESSVDKFKKKLSVLDKSRCGFILKNLKQADSGVYTLIATISKTGTGTFSKNASLTVEVSPQSVPGYDNYKNITLLVKYGETNKDLDCKPISGRNYFCTLYNPAGKIVKQGASCSFRLKYVTKDHIGAWKCLLNLEASMEPVTTFITVKLEDFPKVKTWYKESNNYGIVGCEYINSPDPIKSCSMINPQRSLFKVIPNAATNRYDTYGTNLTQRICQIEFKLPVLTHEIGTWKCILDRNQGFINVKGASQYTRQLPKISAKLNDTIELLYEVPYAANNCFLESPLGIIVAKSSFDQYMNGKCSFNLHDIKITDFGIWTCHFSREDTVEDDELKIEVERYDEIHPRMKSITVDEADEMEILFTANGPISYCALEDPQGNIYHVSPEIKNQQAEYYGRGFDVGDCGMKIKNVSKAHSGIWKCITTLSVIGSLDRIRQMSSEITVEVFSQDALSTASSSSVLIGLVVAIAILMGFVVMVKYVKEKKVKVSPANSISDVNSETAFALTHL